MPLDRNVAEGVLLGEHDGLHLHHLQDSQEEGYHGAAAALALQQADYGKAFARGVVSSIDRSAWIIEGTLTSSVSTS